MINNYSLPRTRFTVVVFALAVLAAVSLAVWLMIGLSPKSGDFIAANPAPVVETQPNRVAQAAADRWSGLAQAYAAPRGWTAMAARYTELAGALTAKAHAGQAWKATSARYTGLAYTYGLGIIALPQQPGWRAAAARWAGLAEALQK